MSYRGGAENVSNNISAVRTGEQFLNISLNKESGMKEDEHKRVYY